MPAFTPQQCTGAELAARTVGRAAVLASVHDKLLAAARSQSRPHALIVGPHGSGKTHVLQVALDRAAADPVFSRRMLVVRIPEDAIDVTRFSDLPRIVLQHLGMDPALEDPLEATDRGLGERVVVLVIENLDRVFADLALAGQRDLRAWVETSGKVLLLASATRLMPSVAQRERPWFGGLAVFVLANLTAQEGHALLLAAARRRGQYELADYLVSPVGLARVRALAAMSDGCPRTWTLIAESADVAAVDAVLPVLRGALEALVPQHQLALAGLSPNERRLVAAIAEVGAGRVADLAAAADLEQRTAAASLGKLAEAGWVVGRKPTRADRRTTYYRLRDPMVRHHLHYRAGRDDPTPLIAALLRAHYDTGRSRPQPDSAPDARAVAAAIAARDPQAAADLLLRSVEAARASGIAPAAPLGSTSWHRLAAGLLDAAAGDEMAGLCVPNELRPLLGDDRRDGEP